ncbi:hypothetical protein TCAL_15326 [Tigriopus californicus]|uniref:protein-L-isoaspartate(D-aspartate) O-methyltransferase n=1 Tax=Tigriopus californicus TaxID=6832 RepID=A0A553PMA6_TIGCA|nr:hypothetical protein TCAL_15326 [Tigriopus californicus]
MAWRSTGKTHQQLIANLKSNGVITSEPVAEAMLQVDRADFCGQSPYAESPQSISHNATISAPHMHAYVLELLQDQLRPGSRALDVGSGSNGVITSEPVAEAMLQVDRADFCGQSPYADSPQSISHNATISAPHMHAYVLELLQDQLRPGSRALDVGSGSGYLTACMAKMVGDNGTVVGIDHIHELVSFGTKNIGKSHSYELEKGTIKLIVGDGRKGFPSEGPYNAIHVGAAAECIPPKVCVSLP